MERKKDFTPDFELIKEQGKQARSAIITMTTLAQSGHPGGSMSTIDMLLTNYQMMNFDPKNVHDANRDKVIVSHGHTSPAVYSALALNGFFNIDEAIAQFRLAKSPFEGHIEPDVPGVEWATGNLGQGLSAATGFALADRVKGIDSKIYVYMGDGEQQKGQISEARRFAVKFQLNNITAFIDYNQLQICGNIHQIMPQNIKDNFVSDGWDVLEIDGHNLKEIAEAINKAHHIDKPVLILGYTTMGKGVSFMENKEKYHGSPLSDSDWSKAIEEIGFSYDLNKFKELRNEIKNKKRYTQFQKQIHPNPVINLGEGIVYEKATDNRSAWGNAIADLAKLNVGSYQKIVVFDNDLKGSVKTADFEKESSETFFQTGIMEHHTAVCASALSKSDIPSYFVGFGVFGIDETYNQHRLSDINHANIKIITTHVGLDVGEDGKTHQCIDYVGLMRNLFHFKVIVPADPNQTDKAVRYSSSFYGNCLISMGRSKLDLIRKEDGSLFFNKDYQFTYGKADCIREGGDYALLVMGTLVNEAVKAVDRLREENISIELWNVSTPLECDIEMLERVSKKKIVFTLEDHHVKTGLGSIIADQMLEQQKCTRLIKFGVEDYAFSGTAEDIYHACGLDSESVYQRIKEIIR